MARRHRGIIAVGAIVVGVSVVIAGTVGGIGSYAWGLLTDDEEEIAEAPAAGFPVSVGKQPEEQKPPAKREFVRQERPKDTKKETGTNKPTKKSQTEIWWEKVNGGGQYTEQFDNLQTAGGSFGGSGGCNVTQPVQVYAMLAMNATTDEPGLTIGGISEDIQGEMSGGEPCIAVPMGSVVTMTVGSAGEYASNRGPVTVDAIYLPSIDGSMGEVVKVGQKAAAYDGVPGIVGKANHHIVSKTFAAIGGGLFQIANNISQIGQFRSGTATGPLEDAMRKTFERPSEIVLSKTGYGFTLMPVTTIGY